MLICSRLLLILVDMWNTWMSTKAVSTYDNRKKCHGVNPTR